MVTLGILVFRLRMAAAVARPAMTFRTIDRVGKGFPFGTLGRARIRSSRSGAASVGQLI